MSSNPKFLLSLIFRITATLLGVICLFFALSTAYLTALKKQYPLHFKKEVCYYAEHYQIDAILVFATIKVESDFNVNAKSPKGAMGLMQITYPTGKFIAQKLGVSSYDLYDRETNIKFGCYYLSYLIKKFPVIETAVVAYNAGEGNVISWLNNSRYSKDGKTLYKIPYLESREYLDKIKKSFTKYKKLYGKIVDNPPKFE